MKTFITFWNNYDAVTEEVVRAKSNRAARKSGMRQYSAAAALMSTSENNSGESGWSHLKKILRHFKSEAEPYKDPSTGITVGRYNAADTQTGSFDIKIQNKEGETEGIEVVSGGGKMFLSMRGHKPTETSPGISIEDLEKKPGWSKIVAEYPDGKTNNAQEKIRDTKVKPFRRLGSALARTITTQKHSGMEEIEKNMKAKHWMIGDHIIPVGSLSHFIHRMSTTQGSPTSPRLAVRVANIIDPRKTKTGEAKKTGTEKSWHIELNNMLHTFTPQELETYGGIRRIRDIQQPAAETTTQQN